MRPRAVSVRIGYDAQIFDIEEHGGISRYFSEIVGEIQRNGFGVEAQVVRPRANAHRYPGVAGAVARRIRSELNLRAAYRSEVDLWHSTYYRARYLPALCRVPHVMTIHDMLPERFPEWFPRGNPHLAKAEYARTVSAVVVPSGYTAAEVTHFYPWLDVPVHVIPEAAGAVFLRAPARRNPPPCAEPYFLYVGRRAGYKNFVTLLAAFASLARAHAGLRLIVVGGGQLSRDEQVLIRGLGLTDRVSCISPTDEALVSCYAYAIALVVTAQAEGFGLPVLEAMATGCPVVSSSGGALPEVAARAALYFEPGNVVQLMQHMQSVADDRIVRQQLVDAGYRRASDFSWEGTARALAALYTGLLPA